MRDVFRFGGYRLVGETVVRAVEGSQIRQQIPGSAAATIQARLSAVQRQDAAAATARLWVQFWTDPLTTALETTVNVVDGRTLVVGTAGGRGDDGAIILAVRAVFEH